MKYTIITRGYGRYKKFKPKRVTSREGERLEQRGEIVYDYKEQAEKVAKEMNN